MKNEFLLLFSLTALLLIVPACYCDEENDYEAMLVNQLLSNYSSLVRPSYRVGGQLIVSLKQIISLDEKNEILTTSSNIYCEWKDPRLTWKPSEYFGVTRTLIQAKKLWLPDLVVTNSADTDIFLKISDYNSALVNYDGKVGVTYSASLLKTRCPLKLDKFPFDKQTCNISIGSWSHDVTRIDFPFFIGLETEYYSPNSLWDLKSNNFGVTRINDRFDDFDNYDVLDVNIMLNLSRRPLYFMINSVFPCLILNLLTLLTFGLPSGPQYSITTTIFLTFSVYSLRTISDMPTDGTFLPTIYVYYLVSSGFTLISFTWFTLDNILRSQTELPAFLVSRLKKTKSLSQPPPPPPHPILNDNLLEANEPGGLNGDIDKRNPPPPPPPSEVVESMATSEKEANKKDSACNRCEYCQECRKKQDKEESDKRVKKEFEKMMKMMNRAVSIGLFVLMLGANLGIWIYLSL